MGRIKMLLATAVAICAVGVGGLVSAPPASALPSLATCNAIAEKGKIAGAWGDIAWQLGDLTTAGRYWSMASAYFDAADDCYDSI